MNNMDIYNKYRDVPESAKKTIGAGRLKGMTDINPMWRLQCLTEAFGMAGVGWYSVINRAWIEDGTGGEKVANVEAYLYVKVDGEWSQPITGIGGSMFVASERNGAHTSDEAFKMAYTDAISVCCKLLGFGADVYWAAGRTKYTAPDEDARAKTEKAPPKAEDDLMFICQECGNVLTPHKGEKGNEYGVRQISEITKKKYGKTLCWDCACKEGEKRKANG